MKVLAIDVGGTHVKILATGQKTSRKFVSGPKMTPRQMVSGVKKLAAGWSYGAVSIGFPAPVKHGRIMREPHNLGPGWVGFDFKNALGRPVTIINDAAMQALGDYRGKKMLFLGLGTGLGSAMVVPPHQALAPDGAQPLWAGTLIPMELCWLPYRKGTFEDYVGLRGLKRFGKKKWRKYVGDVVQRLADALQPDDIVLGGGNVKKLKKLPKGCRQGDNANAFAGGFRLWMKA